MRKFFSKLLIVAMTFVEVTGLLFVPVIQQAQAAIDGGVTSNIRLLDTDANGKIDRITFDIGNPSLGPWVFHGAPPYGLSVTYGGTDISITGVSIPGSIVAAVVGVQVDLNQADPGLAVNTDAVNGANMMELIYTQPALAFATACTGGGAGPSICDDDDQLNAIAIGDAGNSTEQDFAAPVLMGVTKGTGPFNNLTFAYSEPMTVTDGSSTTTKGDITTAGIVEGFGSFAASGDVTTPTTTNTVGGNGTNTLTVTLPGTGGGLTGTTEPSGVFTPVASLEVTDMALAPLQVNTGGTHPTASGSWDLTSPTLSLVHIQSNNVPSAGTLAKVGDVVTISFTSSEAINTPVIGTSTVTNVGGNNWEAVYTVGALDPNGPVTFSIPFTDLAGNTGVGSPVTTTDDASSVTIDSIPPVITITDPAASSVVGGAFQLAVDTTGSAVNCQYATAPFVYPAFPYPVLQDLPAMGGTSFGTTITAATNPYTYYVQCVDLAGNASTEQSRSFTVDAAAPAGTVTTPIATVNSDFYTIAGTLTIDSSYVTVTINNGTSDVGSTVVAPGNPSWAVVVPLPQGAPTTATTFTATGVDMYGNSAGFGSVVITEDVTAVPESTPPPDPVITTTDAITHAGFYTIVGTAGADTPSPTVRSIQVYNGVTLAGTTVVAVGQTAWTLVVPLTAYTLNSFTAKSTDVYGNVSGASTPAVVITEDSTGPAISLIGVSGITQTTATVNFTPDETGTGFVRYGLADSYGNETNENNPTVATVSAPVLLTGLTCGTTYHYIIVARDAYGNETSPADATFGTTACTVDILPPADLTVVNPGSATYVVGEVFPVSGTLTPDTDPVTIRLYSDTGAPGVIDGTDHVVASVNIPALAGGWTVLAPLLSLSANDFLVTATDASNNETVVPVDVPTITTVNGPDVSFTNPTAGEVFASGASFDATWSFTSLPAGWAASIQSMYSLNGSAWSLTTDATTITSFGTLPAIVTGTNTLQVRNVFTTPGNQVTVYSPVLTFYFNPVDGPTFSFTSPLPGSSNSVPPGISGVDYTITGGPTGATDATEYSLNGSTFAATDSPTSLAATQLITPILGVNTFQLKDTRTFTTGPTQVYYSQVLTFTMTDALPPASLAVVNPGLAQDVVGEVFPVSGTIGVDTGPVTIRLYTDANNDGIINGTDHVVASVSVATGATSWTVEAPLVPLSANNFTVTASDAADNASAPANVPTITTIDGPTITFTNPSPSQAYSSTATYDATWIFNPSTPPPGYDGVNDPTVKYSLNGGPSWLPTTSTIALTGLDALDATGDNTFQIWAHYTSDTAVDFSVYSQVLHYYVNPADAPAITLVDPANDLHLANGTVSTAAHYTIASGPIGSTDVVTASLNGSDFNISGTATTATLSPLVVGSNNYQIRVVRSYLYAPTETFYSGTRIFYVDAADTTNPTFINSTPTTGAVGVSIAAGSATLNYSENLILANEPVITIAQVGGASIKNGVATVSGSSLTINYSGPLAYGTSYKITVPAAAVTDLSSNPAAFVEIYFTTQTSTAPDITGLSVSGVTNTTATINWSTDVTADSGQYRLATTAYSGTWTALTIGGTSGTQPLSALTASTTYYYQVRFTKNGSTVNSVPLSFITAVSNTGISVDSIQMVKTFATADNNYANGWAWKFNITINNMSETNVAMEFAQWISGANMLDAASNMQYSIDNSTWTTITGNATPSVPAYGANISVAAVDNDINRGGRQVTLYVQMKVPVSTPGGSYSTSYGIRSL